MTKFEGMTPRQRIRNTIRFRRVDMIPWVDQIQDEILVRFMSEGLPPHRIANIDWAMANNGLLTNWPVLKGFDPYSYFGCTDLWGCIVPLDLGPIPRFKQRKTSQSAEYEDYVTEVGQRARRLRKGVNDVIWYRMPFFLEFPVSDEKSWEEYKARLDPDDPRRYPKDWEKEGYVQLFEQYEGGPTVLAMDGFYGFGAQLMGIVNFNLSLYKDPELIKDMVSYWEYYTIQSIREAVETLKDRVDLVFWWEDMAEKHGPNISPKLYKEFLLPHYKQVIGFLNRNGIDRVIMDSDGNINPILDLVIEAGITGTLPLEVNSGMDARDLRKRYGEKLFLMGNFDKREIVKGGEPMRREIDSKLEIMKETGGYIAGLDHDVPIDFTLQRFQEYADYLKPKLIVE